MPHTRPSATISNLKLALIAPLLALAACTDGNGKSNASATLAAAPAGDQAAAACATCHTGAMSLAGRDPDEVAKLIEAIVAGDRPHPPVSLQGADSASIAALARTLTAD